ncbi:G-protein coupled receptor GRL101-like protein [Trichoplax sp. H2]|nr:G-protein coupled receptor GRL101-like protein [Trichoplax sp. H2]|eukprot:RDD37223.1 G-protein coupled receptor GRL101-like protein [Trichoplax sp. H2]
MATTSTLRLTFNNISVINATAFEDLYNLTSLDLAGNKLTLLDSLIFQPLIKLQDLRLQTNKLSFIDTGAFSGLNKLQLLQLSGNPIRNFYEFQLPAVAFMDFLGLSRSYPLKLHGNGNLAKAKKNSVVIKVLLRRLQNPYFYFNDSDANKSFLGNFIHKSNLSYNKLHEKNTLNFSTLDHLVHLAVFVFYVSDLTGNRYRNIESAANFFTLNNYNSVLSLNVSSNALYNIHLDALEPFAKLQSLMLQYNNLQKLDFIRPLSQLIVLSLTSNSIKAINVKDFAKLASLKELYLDHNEIGTLNENYFMNTKLNSLYLQHNQISDVNAVLKGLKNIRIIYLSDNAIETLKNKSFSLYPNLRILDLSNNAVTLSDQEDLGLTFLEELNLAGNEITYLNCSGLPPVLRSLTLANNNIVKFDPNCDRLFYQVTKIDISYTNLIANGIDLQKDFLDKLNLVNDLKLAGNNWPGILEGMAAIINLKLDISDNPVILDTFIRDLYDRVGQFLIGIQLNKCNISTIPTKAFTFDDLRVLSLNDNNLREFDMFDVSGKDVNVLTELSVANNKLKGIKSSLLIRYVYLKKLNISGNQIVGICGANLDIVELFPNIREIDASGNNIEKLKERCFKGLSNLQKLDLRMNLLAYISRESFFGPPQLVETLTNRPYFCCMIPAKIVTCEPSMMSDTLSSCRHLLAHISLQSFVWVVGCLAFFGNIMVMLYNHYTKDTLGKAYILLINNLAVSDFIMSIYLFIIAFANSVYSSQDQYGQRSEDWLENPLCILSCILVTTSSLVSVFLMMIISIDRFIIIIYSNKRKQLSMAATRAIISSTWLASFLFVLIPALYSINQPGHLRLYTYNSMCMPSNYENPSYRLWMITYIVITIIAWIITCSLYIAAFISIRNTHKAARRSVTNENKVLAIRLSIILLTDLICWLPYYVVNNFGFVTSKGVDVITLQFVGIFALPINSALNPFLYTITSTTVFKGLFIHPINKSTSFTNKPQKRGQKRLWRVPSSKVLTVEQVDSHDD